MAILAARTTRTPLATILAAMPYLIKQLRQMEQAQGPRASAMTRNEAALILGIEADATAEQVQDAHRRLIQKNHPDVGGTDYLAAKINQARDILLKP